MVFSQRTRCEAAASTGRGSAEGAAQMSLAGRTRRGRRTAWRSASHSARQPPQDNNRHRDQTHTAPPVASSLSRHTLPSGPFPPHLPSRAALLGSGPLRLRPVPASGRTSCQVPAEPPSRVRRAHRRTGHFAHIMKFHPARQPPGALTVWKIRAPWKLRYRKPAPFLPTGPQASTLNTGHVGPRGDFGLASPPTARFRR